MLADDEVLPVKTNHEQSLRHPGTEVWWEGRCSVPSESLP